MIVIITLLTLLLIHNTTTEYLINKPSNEVKKKLSKDIISNKHLFGSNSSFENARSRLTWLDAITYEDARILYNDNQLNSTNMMNYL
jgi:hypothetical protein